MVQAKILFKSQYYIFLNIFIFLPHTVKDESFIISKADIWSVQQTYPRDLAPDTDNENRFNSESVRDCSMFVKPFTPARTIIGL